MSPYLLLFSRGDGTIDIVDYFTLVRPMLRQQAINVQVNAQLRRLQNELLTPQPPVDEIPSRARSAAQFMNRGRYYRSTGRP